MEIINYPNYLIYKDGRVYSKKNNKFLKPKRQKNGYERITLYNENGRPEFSIHRLVGIHYIPNPNNYPTIDHINRKRDDNRVENLRWANMKQQSENRDCNFILITNKSGFKYISQRNDTGSWVYRNQKYKIQKTFKTKIEAICYKYIVQLRIKAKHFD